MKHLILFIVFLFFTNDILAFDSVLDQIVKNMYGSTKKLRSTIDIEEGHITLFVFWKPYLFKHIPHPNG